MVLDQTQVKISLNKSECFSCVYQCASAFYLLFLRQWWRHIQRYN